MTATTADAGTASPGRSSALGLLQRIGRSLLLPIVVLVPAGLLLRFGQGDMLGRFEALQPVAKVMAAAGEALFANLPILFAIGVAIGFARRADGTTALAALVGYLVFDRVTRVMFSGSQIKEQVLGPPAEDGTRALNLAAANPTGVLGGILIGITAALLWQRFYRIALPSWLAFFGGRRFVPIITALVALLLGVLFGWIWAPIGTAISNLGDYLVSAGALGAGLYGAANRALIPLGLHHIINSIVWVNVGECTANGKTFTGDIPCFLNQGTYVGGEKPGLFQAGFFPIMMFALPAACLAMVQEARSDARKKAVAGILLAAALTSFLTGITEPIEFAFIFVAPVLFVIHIVLTGTSLALVAALGIRDGFSFSAGLIDYLINFNIATKPLLIIPIGLGYAVVYYLLFRFFIRRFNLLTPGREPEEDDGTGAAGRRSTAADGRSTAADGGSTGAADDSPGGDAVRKAPA
ncbi:MAG TPA: PTS transporter subunit EIIC [Cryptosporangiaceae bacterium]|nr:PTS transporter subunit EIIC [Cryptosporangiaceae bacterium]